MQAGITTPKVYVLVSDDCKDLKDVSLIINGDEAHKINLLPPGACHWTINLGDGTISTSTATFSLRADLKRSGCQRAAADNETRYANIEFHCCAKKGKFRNVSVTIKPPMPASYVRRVRPFPDDRVPGIDCRESAPFDEGQGVIPNTLFDLEDVYLQLGPYDRKRQAPGLLHLNEIVFEDGVRVLMRDDVIYRLMVKRARGKLQSAPTTSPNAISLDIKKLTELKFERAEFEVIK